MALGFFKKKKKKAEDLVPPEPPVEEKEPPEYIGDFPPIIPEAELPPPRAFPKSDIPEDLPELQFPEIPEEELELPLPPRPPAVEPKLPPPPKPMIPVPEEPVMPPRVFDKTIEEEMPKRAEVIRPRLKPIFVGVTEYNKIMNSNNVIRSKLLEAEDFAKNLSDLKNQEEKLLERWRSKLEDVDKKLNYVDELVNKAQG